MATAVDRAPRVTMETPVLVRRAGEPTWRRASTINISRTGLLMQSDGFVLEPQTPVEVIVALPVYGNLAATRIFGVGRIVRSVAPLEMGPDAMMAAHLDEYRVLLEGVES